MTGTIFRLPLLLLVCGLGPNVAARVGTPLRANAASAFIVNNDSPVERTAPTRLQLKRRGPTALHATAPANKPRSGVAQLLLDAALASPVWKHVLVPQARASIVKTAERNGIPWEAAKEWITGQEDSPWQSNNDAHGNIQYPDYYLKSFHAYDAGNLSWDAAFEQELASRSIGARNFPKYSSQGEDVFRGAFDRALQKLGAGIDGCDNRGLQEDEIVIVDFGCGTGTSTRRLAKQYPRATKLIGIDMSPYFIDVGRTLLKLSPPAIEVTDGKNDPGWITAIDSDARIDLRQGDIADTQLPAESVSAVNLGLVLHELPIPVAKRVLLEAHRILRPGGQLWISEMDFESPAYRAQRENALLFSLLRATEPYLDEYADGMPELRDYAVDIYESVRITAATGRHYAMVAEKGRARDEAANGEGRRRAVLEDNRFRGDGSYAIEDTHLKPWESKQYS